MAVERAARLATVGGIQQVEPVHLIMRKNNSVRFAQILAISLVISGGQVPAAESVDADWKAGVAKAKITPEQPLWLSGYGSRDRPSEGTRVDLWVKALALQDAGGRKALLITLDLVGIDRGISVAVCSRLIKRYGLERGQILLSTSHTHTGPVVGENLRAMYFFPPGMWQRVEAYTKQLQEKIVTTAGEAFGRLEPARLAWGSGTAGIGVNRRTNPEADVLKLRAGGKLKGPVDHDVPVLSVHDGEGRLVAAAFGYACHATVLSDYKWSGDYPGYAQVFFEQAHPGAVGLFWAGCGADVNPLPRREVELAEKYGRELAAAVDATLAGEMKPLAARLDSVYREIDLPFEKIPTRTEIEANLKSENRYDQGRARVQLRRLKKDSRLAPTYPYPVATWRLGDELTFVSLGGEVVVDYALRLKRELGQATWVAGYSHDVMAYIPSLRVWNEGGYEGGGAMLYYGLPSRWDSTVEQQVITEALRQAATLRQPAQQK